MLKQKSIVYAGIDNPGNIYEMEVEILGLKNVIKQCEEKISRLEQAYAIFKMESAMRAHNESTQNQSGAENTSQETKEGD